MSRKLPRTGEGAIDHDQAIASRSNDLTAPPPFPLSELDIRRKHDSVVTFILGRGVMRVELTVSRKKKKDSPNIVAVRGSTVAEAISRVRDMSPC